MPRSPKNIKVYANVSQELNQRLEDLCSYLCVTKSSFITMAIAQYVQQQEAVKNLASNTDFLSATLTQILDKKD